jgi:hypothetical protein
MTTLESLVGTLALKVAKLDVMTSAVMTDSFMHTFCSASVINNYKQHHRQF